MTADNGDCARLREMGAEVALGISDGADRAWALDHLADCTECRARIERMSTVADELLLLAPVAEPPAGFEERVAGAIEPARRRWPRLRVVIPAFAAAAIAAAAVWFALADDRELADSYRDTLAVAHGERFAAAPVDLADGSQVGYIYGYQGRASWVFAVMYDCPYDGTYELEGVTADGSSVPISPIEISDGRGSIGKVTSVDYDSLTEVRMVDDNGHVVAASELG
jgi:hypothetical protein